MKNTIIALACVLISSTTFAASMTMGSGWSNTTGNGTYVHKGTETIKTDKKTSLVDGDKSSKTTHTGTLTTREGYLGETSMVSQSNTTYMGSGSISQGTVTASHHGSDTVVGHPWGAGYGSGNESLDQGYKGASYLGTTVTKNKTADGKETVITTDNWTESGYFDRSTEYGGQSTTTYVE